MELYVSVIVGVVMIGLLVYAYYNYRKIGDEAFVKGINADGFEEIIKKLEAKIQLDKQMLLSLAADVATRQNLFHVLKSYHRLDLFPDDFYTIKDGAASNLANWVATEEKLNYPPSDILLVQTVAIQIKGVAGNFHVFKFKIDPPHFAATRGWMLGVVGPYYATNKPFDWPEVVVSRFKSIESTNPEEEVQWAHQSLME